MHGFPVMTFAPHVRIGEWFGFRRVAFSFRGPTDGFLFLLVAARSYPNTSADLQTLVKHYRFWQSSGIFIKFGTLSLCARSSYELPPRGGRMCA